MSYESYKIIMETYMQVLQKIFKNNNYYKIYMQVLQWMWKTTTIKKPICGYCNEC